MHTIRYFLTLQNWRTDLMKTIGEILKSLRLAKGYSQDDVAKLLHIGRTTYLKYENGDNKPTRKLNELANLFGVSTDYILGHTTSLNDNITNIDPNNTITLEELAIIQKYRKLDKRGQLSVNYTLDKELEINNKYNELNNQEAIS